jgi:hypothetical protein
VVRDFEHQILEVDELARDVEANDLPGARADQLLPVREAAHKQGAVRNRLAFPQQIAFAAEGTVGPGQPLKRALVVLRNSGSSLPAAEQSVKDGKIAQLRPRCWAAGVSRGNGAISDGCYISLA